MSDRNVIFHDRQMNQAELDRQNNSKIKGSLSKVNRVSYLKTISFKIKFETRGLRKI